MKLIVPHRNPDFDAFASAVAAKLLYPDYEIVISGQPNQNLEEYIKIYEDKFPFLKESSISVDETVECAIVVDTASPKRISKKVLSLIEKAKKVIIYDHHPGIKEGGLEGESHIEALGATTTMMVEMIREKGIEIDSITATLFMIAIYEDTGNLLYSSTTPRDLEAAKFLLENGANLVEVSEYIKLDLTYDQQQIFEKLLEDQKEYNVNGVPVVIAKAEYEKFVGGLNIVTGKIWNHLGVETLISVIKMGKKVYIIGRTSSPDVDIGGLMKELGGGGHKKAGSASIKAQDINEVLSQLFEKLKKHITPALRARDVMSSPVKVIYANQKIEEANRIMEMTGHNGFPVVEGNKLVGIVTKKAVDKAMNHGLGDRPVKSIMMPKLITATPDTPLNQIRQMMVENSIGRIPVLENGVLVGIVTRTDILRAIFGNTGGKKRVEGVYIKDGKIFTDIKDIMRERIPPRILNLLRLLGTLAEEIDMKIYVVGGFVRDLLLGKPNEDIDIVVEGSGVEFAKYVAKFFKVKVVNHDQFMTASLFFKDGFRIDIATARTEYYQSPAKLPEVDISTIRNDLYRRDFTINAMAIKLNPGEFGILYDFFSGKKDLENGIIRALHTLSFVDDPTRILRAVRFEQRFDFRIEEVTEKLMREAVDNGYLEKVTGMRLRQEIEKILKESEPLKTIRRLASFDAIKHLFPRTFYTQVMDEKLKRMFTFLPWAKEYFKKVNDFYALVYIFLEYYDEGSLEYVKFIYSIPDKVTNELRDLEKRVQKIVEAIKNSTMPSQLHDIFKKISPEGVCYIASYLEEEDQKKLKNFFERLKSSKPKVVNGKYLQELGVKPGPEIGRIIDEVIKAKLDDRVKDEESFVKELIGIESTTNKSDNKD
ncbi:MAG: CBS domain-containing protein [Thermotogaceae bacterium]|nr:CBS domain-containing protein [Thermotogaceae bacterium]